MKPVRPLLALALAILAVTPASATHGGIHPKFRSQAVYFHCTGDTPSYNVNGASGDYAQWDTSPPPGSVTDGNGCGVLDPGSVSNETWDAVFEGTVAGNLRDLTVRIYDFLLNGQRTAGAPIELRIYAEIDGIPLFPRGSTQGAYQGRVVTVTPSRTNSDLTDLLEFSVTNIGFANEIKDSSGNVIDVETGGAALEDGNGATEHRIKLLLGLDDAPPSSSATTGLEFWVWDTTEVPSGITFNPVVLAPNTVEADLPNFG